MLRFLTGFCSVLAVFIFLNVASYFLFPEPGNRTLGFPRHFWREGPDYTKVVFGIPRKSEFSGLRFVGDVFFAFASSIGVGVWWMRVRKHSSKQSRRRM